MEKIRKSFDWKISTLILVTLEVLRLKNIHVMSDCRQFESLL